MYWGIKVQVHYRNNAGFGTWIQTLSVTVIAVVTLGNLPYFSSHSITSKGCCKN